MKVTKEQFIGMTYDELLAENEKLWALNEHMGLKDMAVIGGLEKENERLKAYNAKLRELATYALKHIIEFECEVPDREMLRGKPCEDCADYGSSDCPKCMPRMFDVSGIEVDG